MINKNRLIKLLQDLIRINSENPNGNEFKIAGFVKDHLSRLGLRPKIYEFKKKRSNLIAVLRSDKGKRSLLITPHLDTVPAGKSWSFPPFGAKKVGGKIYGLGATDCKCNLAVSLEVINSLVEDRVKLDYDLIIAATADEESGSGLGLIPLLDKGILKPDAAVVLDADDFNIVVAQKGLVHLKVIISGKKAHGAYPWRGENAIELALEILSDLKKKKLAFTRNKYLHPPTMNIGTIKGGDKVNVVADWCEFELDFRFMPKDKSSRILDSLKDIIKKRAKKFKIEIEGIQEPYSIDEGHPLVKGLFRSMRKFKLSPVLSGSEGATVITFFQDKSIPAVATGFGREGCAHTADEFVRIKDVYKGAKVLENFLKEFKFV